LAENKYFLLTVDVEDWFQVENFKPWIPFSTWDRRELRVERNVHRLLDLFDSVQLIAQSSKHIGKQTESSRQRSEYRDQKGELRDQNPKNIGRKTLNSINSTNSINPTNCQTKKVKATFFVLGWIAEKLPHLIREIQTRGHEVASHGCNHDLPDKISGKELQRDLSDSKKKLEDITGNTVYGFRAPSFALNDDILKTIDDSGYNYDSSYNSFSFHGRYGQISLKGSGKRSIAHKLSDNFYELPISNLEFGNTINYWLSAMRSGRNEKRRFVLPWGGGAYFRLIPYWLFRQGIESILKKHEAYLFYMHPWELDIDQPRVTQATLSPKFRHYSNIDKTRKKLKRLIKEFNGCRFITCRDYLTI
jgi:polysaccharide deacetylase family protein (PEP-CTERM system associated)